MTYLRPGSYRYRRYPAASLEAARSWARAEAPLLYADGFTAIAEHWDEPSSTLVVTYIELADRPRREGLRARLMAIAAAAVAIVLIVAATGLRFVPSVPSGAEVPTATPRPTQPASGAPVATVDPYAGAVPRYEATECRSEWATFLPSDCGDLIVLEDRAEPDGRRIVLHVAVVRSDAATPLPDPVVYLEGGPGGSALTTGFYAYPFLERRDVIVMDQRGTGYSEPSLQCSEFVFLLGQAEADALRRCRTRLVGQGIDLADYHTAASAADLEDLRRALGYEQWNLYGVSYGTRLALTVLRDHHTAVRSVILDSVYPPGADIYGDGGLNAQRAFDALFQACAADRACGGAHPDLEAHFYELVERLDAEPRRAGALLGLGGLEVDGSTLVLLLFEQMYVTELLGGLPAALERFHAGDWSELDTWALPLTDLRRRLALPWDALNVGLYYSVQCAEALPFLDRGRLGELDQRVSAALRGAFDWQFLVDNCAAWEVPAAQSTVNQPVSSSVPALLLAGTFDPVTPPAWAELAAGTLSRSWPVVVPGAAHGVLGTSYCVDDIVGDFLAAPDVLLYTGCTLILGDLDFDL